MIIPNTNYIDPADVDLDVVKCNNCGHEDYTTEMVQYINPDDQTAYYLCTDCYLNPKV